MNESDEIEVFPTTAQLRVYFNTRGDIVLCQADTYGDDDSLIYVPTDRVDDLVSALLELKTKAGEAE